MDSVKNFQKAAQQNAARPLGYSTWWERVFVVSVKHLGHEADHLRDPVFANMAVAQDPVTGSSVFVAGLSSAGGPDPAA